MGRTRNNLHAIIADSGEHQQTVVDATRGKRVSPISLVVEDGDNDDEDTNPGLKNWDILLNLHPSPSV